MCEATLRVSCIWVLYTLKIFVPVQNRGQYSRGQYSSGQYSRGQYLKHLRIALFFDLKGNPFVLSTKFYDPQMFFGTHSFFSNLWFSQIFFGTPRFFFALIVFFSNFSSKIWNLQCSVCLVLVDSIWVDRVSLLLVLLVTRRSLVINTYLAYNFRENNVFWKLV